MKQKKFWNKQMTMKLFVVVVMVLVATMPMLAQSNPIDKVTGSLSDYPRAVRDLMFIIGGIVGLIGAIRVYIKWQNGDQDVQKALVGWAGALIFLIVAGLAVNAFFGVAV